MNEKTRIKIITFILIIAVIWAGSNYISENKKIESSANTQTVAKISPENIKPVKKELPEKVIETSRKTDWGRNPFFSPHFAIADFSSDQPNEDIVWVLSGIFFSTSTPTAIINKRPVKVGQTINNAKVVQINKEEVTLKIDNQELKLTISKG